MNKSHWLGLALVVGSALPALAAVGTGYTLFGDATFVSPGNNSNRAVKLVADTAGGSGFAGVDFAVPAGLTVNELDSLSTDYRFPAGSTCKDGSPRFQINVDTGSGIRNIFVYIGPPPSYTGCPSNGWTNTTNLLDASDLVDTQQLGGAPFQPYASAQAQFGTLPVTGVQLVADEFTGPQTVLVDNTDVDGTLYDYEFESKDDCKKGGFRDFTTTPGPFKNQGQCVSHFARNK